MTSAIRSIIAAGLLFAFPAGGHAQQAVAWPDLVDAQAQVFEDPYRDLSIDQIDQLRTIVKAREILSRAPTTEAETPAAMARLEEAEDALAESGIDADWLISQRWIVADKRETAATAGNTAMDGQSVEIAGYAIPAPPDSDGVPAIYLVEMRGMCSHMPPPNPNQLIRVRLETDWSPEFMHQPVRLIGQIHLDPSERVIRVVDGNVPMEATWRLEAASVEVLTARTDGATAGSDWVEQMRSRFRASQAAKGE